MPPCRPQAIILFDGICNLCNRTVNFIIDRDPEGYFQFAPLQSDVAQTYVDGSTDTPSDPDTIVLYKDGDLYSRSTAALHIARRLTGPWPLLAMAFVIPRPVRDAIYDWIAKNRYDWFGRRDQCRMPTPELKDRFLKYDDPESH